MYRFQVSAITQTGESIGLVGSTPQLGQWDVRKCVHLGTSGDRYPLWWVDIDIHPFESSSKQKIEYKYIRLGSDGSVQWESWGQNRWVPLESDHISDSIIVEDGWLGHVQPWPYGYHQQPAAKTPVTQLSEGLKIAVVGSSVALGCSAWLLKGWARRLEKTLAEKYGHQLVNLSQLGANVTTTINRFPLVVAPQQPDIVIIALSLGNEGLAYCPPHERRAVQRRFERGLQQLIKMTKELGAIPILGGLYPHGDYSQEHHQLLWDTHNRMLSWGIPVLDWLAALDNGKGGWKTGISFDPAHPNTAGHRLMFGVIDLNLFQIDKNQLEPEKQLSQQQELPIYRDDWGFHIFARPDEKSLRIINTSKSSYKIDHSWQELQTALQTQAGLMPGVYIAKNAQMGTIPFFSVSEDGKIETQVDIPPATDLEYSAAFNFLSAEESENLYYDGHLALLKESNYTLRIINESDHEYNIHPMWKEVRNALKGMPAGVYEDTLYPDVPFRTMMIGNNGLESRVKVPPKSSVLLKYKCKLSDINRVAILPLGDRCAARMLLYKMQYDGPAFPFDLTRTTNLGDVADMIATGFEDMWNPAFLHYNHDAGRIYHSKWSGLSFAHEVEETDDPVNNMFPVYERMRVRYTARSQRFWYTLKHCDKVLFVRTGVTNRGYVIDLMSKLESKCQGKQFRLLLISPQPSHEFFNIPDVLHYNLEFNPDRMYEDLGYWMHCTEVMRGILEYLGISSKNLFWCPPNPPKDEVKQ